MIDFRLITKDELCFLINEQTKYESIFKIEDLSRDGMINFIESQTEKTTDGMEFDSYYKISAQVTRLRKFKEVQEDQLKQFLEVITKY
jgi:hypothetical protein